MNDQLWTRRELTVTVVLGLIGAAGFGYCWYRGSGVASFDSEQSWLFGCAGCAGVIVAALFHRVYTGLRRLKDLRHQSIARSLRLFPDAADEFLGVGEPA